MLRLIWVFTGRTCQFIGLISFPIFLWVFSGKSFCITELQWLEHWWLVNHGGFEIVLESLGKISHSCRILDSLGWFSVYIENGILCVLIRIASMRRFYLEHTTYLHVKENREDILIMTPDLALLLTLISSNYPCLEHIFIVPKVFEPLKFYCICIYIWTRLEKQWCIPARAISDYSSQNAQLYVW